MQIGFNRDKDVKISSSIVPHNFENGICFGKTGSGKTSSFMLPNIKDRIRSGYSLIIYDFKGNLHYQVKQIAKDFERFEDVVEIGKLWGKKINMLKNCSVDTLSNIYDTLHGRSNDDYWKNSSNRVVVGIYKILKSLMDILSICKDDSIKTYIQDILSERSIDTISFKSIKSILQDVTCLSNFLNQTSAMLYDIVDTIDKKSEIDEKLTLFLSQLHDNLQILSEYFNTEKNGEIGGKYGVLGVANSVINSISALDFLNVDELDIYQAINDKKIIIINVSSIQSNILTALNIAIYSELTKRESYSDIQPLSIFIDEAQKVLSEDYVPDVDVCRENRFEYIFATQDKLLLANKISLQKSEELLKNISLSISFQTKEADGDLATDKLKKFEYVDIDSGKKSSAVPIFFDDDILYQTEQKYLQNIEALSPIKNIQKDDYIVIHKTNIAQENKTILFNYKTREKEVIYYITKNATKEAINNLRSLKNSNEHKSFAETNNTKSKLKILDSNVAYLKEKINEQQEFMEKGFKNYSELRSNINSLKTEIKTLKSMLNKDDSFYDISFDDEDNELFTGLPNLIFDDEDLH